MTYHGGRWPANVVLDEHCASELDRQSGTRKSSGIYEGDGSRNEGHRSTSFAGGHRPNAMYADTGGASRFFYVAKAPKSERPVVSVPRVKLRDDLTPEQVDHVRARLREVGIVP